MDNPIIKTYGRDRNVISIDVPYDNIVWSRRYYEFGQFQIEIPAKFFDASWAYVSLSGHKEFGIILKSTYTSSNMKVIISGFFAEWILDYAHALPRFQREGEVVASCYNMFDLYYDMQHVNPIVASPKAVFPIHKSEAAPVVSGRTYTADFLGEKIGTKMLKMLRDDQMSYRVMFEEDTRSCSFAIYKGADRTSNDKMIFSETMGDLTDVTVSVDMSVYANWGLIIYGGEKAMEENPGLVPLGGYPYLENRGNMATYGIYPLLVQSSLTGGNGDLFELDARAKEELSEKMNENDRIVTVSAQFTDQTIFDKHDLLGNLVELSIESYGLTMSTRIVEMDYVYKENTRQVTVGFGDQRVTNLQRAIGALKS